MFDIIIPQFKESESDIKLLLDSIESQIGISKHEIIVTIINDHSDKILSMEFLKKYSYRINYYRMDYNVGPGVVKQWALDNTNSPYFMFCDADDSLYSNDVLLKIFTRINTLIENHTNWAFIQTNLLEETVANTGEKCLVEHNYVNARFLPAKVFNREFIINHHIRFHNTLRFMEDYYFGEQVLLSAKPNEIIKEDYISYMWYYTPGSLTYALSGKNVVFMKCDDYVTCILDLLDVLEHRVCLKYKDIQLFAYQKLILTYFTLNTDEFKEAANGEKTNKLRMLCSKLIFEYLKSFNISIKKQKKYFEKIKKTEINSIKNNKLKFIDFQKFFYNQQLDLCSIAKLNE